MTITYLLYYGESTGTNRWNTGTPRTVKTSLSSPSVRYDSILKFAFNHVSASVFSTYGKALSVAITIHARGEAGLPDAVAIPLSILFDCDCKRRTF